MSMWQAVRARVRRWALAPAGFPLRRAAVWATALLIMVGVGAVTTLAANADPAGGGTGPFGAVDVADSRGIRVSQYELSIDGGSVLNPFQLWISMRLLAVWNFYRIAVALIAYVFDWTLSMSWLDTIVTPIDAAAQQIRDQLIAPIGLAGLMLLLSAVVGGIRIVHGKTGRGIWDVLSAAAVAAAVAALLVSPVASVTGTPLTKTRNAGLATAAMIDGKDLAATDINGTPQASQLTPAPVLIDAFVRPAHGLINYGINFTDQQKCTPAYDKALKAGPHFDPTNPDQRKAVASCDKALGDYADKRSVYAASFGMGVFVFSAILVAITILAACVLLFVAVMMLAWSLLKLVISGVIGIGPGDTRGPMIRNALDVLASLIYVAVSTVVLAIILVLIKRAFAADLGSLMARFLLVDVVLIGSLVIVVQTWLAHRRGAKSWADKIMGKLKQSVPKPTVGARVGSWLKAPAGGEAAKYGGLDGYGPGGGGGAGSPFGFRRMIRPVTHSNAFQLARLGALTAATGGSAGLVAAKFGARVAAHSVAGTVDGAKVLGGVAGTGARWAGIGVGHAAGSGARVVGDAAAAGARWAGAEARHTADTAQRIHATYTAVRDGSRRATAGPHVDPWISRAVQARNFLHHSATGAAADVALTLGSTRHQAERQPDRPTAQIRVEDTQRGAQRADLERRLTRPTPEGRPAAPASTGTGRSAAAAKPAPKSSVVVESSTTAAERLRGLTQPVDHSRANRGPKRPMQR